MLTVPIGHSQKLALSTILLVPCALRQLLIDHSKMLAIAAEFDHCEPV